AGGHLLFALTNYKKLSVTLSQLFSVPLSLSIERLKTVFGGNVFYGGLVGSIISTLIYTKYSKVMDREITLNDLAVCIPLFHSFGRIGCFFGGCCYGKESGFGFVMAHNDFVPEAIGVRRFPVQLAEALCNALLFIVLLYLYKKKRKRLIIVYLASYSVIRFVLEFFRGDLIRGIYFGLSTSQWISIIIFSYCLIFWIIKKRQRLE
ncbi:MAG: prolipoprotein diacylglyceryl transferase, partial [Clostridia bacterium]|nr:prolipoprotein diacylglyceryl transferase [Clostridia bacterium]